MLFWKKKLDINAEFKKLTNPNLTLEQLNDILVYLDSEYSKEFPREDFSVYMSERSFVLRMTRQNEWGRLLDFFSKRQDEIIAQSADFDEYQNSYYL